MGELEHPKTDLTQCSEVFEHIEELKYRLEQLRAHCEDCAKKNQELQKEQVVKEKTYQRMVCDLNDELVKLRETKMHILRENIMKECAVAPRWFNSLTKSVNQEKTIKIIREKLEEQSVQILEKDAIISSLKWKVEDLQATVTILKADQVSLNAEMKTDASRLKEAQLFANELERNENSRNRIDNASLHSYENETANHSDKASQTQSRNSYAESDGSWIEIATQTMAVSSGAEVEQPSFTTAQSASTREKDENENYICHDKESEIVTDIKDETITENFRHGSITWETFDQSRNAAEFKGRIENFPEKLSVDRVRNESDDPWVSPLHSPAVTENTNGLFNAFWVEQSSQGESDEKDENDHDDSFLKELENYGENLADNQHHINKNSEQSSESSPQDNNTHSNPEELVEVRVQSPCQSEFISEKSEIDSWNSNGSETPEKPNLPEDDAISHSLWDFEPDSIVDVSTGETIYESGSAPNTPESKSRKCSKFFTRENGVKSRDFKNETLTESHDFGLNKKNRDKSNDDEDEKDTNLTETELESHDMKLNGKCISGKQRTSVNTNINQKRMIFETKSQGSLQPNSKSKLKYGSISNREKATLNHLHRNIEFVRKSPKKEREALDAYMQWKTQGKKGDPPSNFKVSLC